LKRNLGRNSIGSEVYVPYKSVEKNKIESFFEEKNISNKNILINVDHSHLIGMKRLVIGEYLEQNVYKGHS